VLANALDDRHPDHGRAGHLISESCFLSGLRKVETVDSDGLAQEHWRPKYVFHFIQTGMPSPPLSMTSALFLRQTGIDPGLFLPVHTGNYGKEEPQTYISTPEFLNSIIGRHQMFGKMIGVPYAEGSLRRK